MPVSLIGIHMTLDRMRGRDFVVALLVIPYSICLVAFAYIRSRISGSRSTSKFIFWAIPSFGILAHLPSLHTLGPAVSSFFVNSEASVTLRIVSLTLPVYL